MLYPRALERLEATFGVPVLNAYGMTEAAHQISSTRLPAGGSEGTALRTSVGYSSGPAVAVLNSRNEMAACGERGEVVLRGEQIIGAYLRPAEANDTAFWNGWFRTGDEGFLDADGALTLTGRLKEIIKGLEVAHKGIKELLEVADQVVEAVRQPKLEWTKAEPPAELVTRVKELAEPRVEEALTLAEKAERTQALSAMKATISDQLAEEFPDKLREIVEVIEGIEYNTMRERVLTAGERVDGRDLDTVRPITCEVGWLPRAHGSALFTRGQTQALATVTLGTTDDEQRIDSIDVAQETTKSFMLHYNFPPFSTGEVKPVRGTSRREIGHGALAERALQAVLPPYEQFPYTIRIVSEILESNGSSSMATVCSGSLALMDAGVPVKSACAGVAMGLIAEGGRTAILTDILGTEDHLGDMDFKVAGTRDGVTSIQMDIKIERLDWSVIGQALEKARKARIHILDIMQQAMPEPRSQLSKYAPRIITIQIRPDKIGDLIGPKGKTIRGIQEQTGAEINVDDSGLVTIAGVGEAAERARDMVSGIVQEPEVGKVYEGVVKSTTAFGAFVEIIPGVEGLLHISELQHGRTEKTEDVVKKGDHLKVKLLEVDERGRMRLSRKALIEKN